MPSSHEAFAMLDEIARVRRRTLQPYRPLWYPLVLFGALSLGAAPLYVLAPSATSAYWLVGTIVAWIAIGRHYARRGRSVGVGRPRGARRTSLHWWAVWLAIALVGTVGASMHSTATVVAGVAGVLGAGYGWIAWRARDGVLTAMGAALAGAGVAVAVVEPRHPYTVLMLAIGALLSLTGLYLHAVEGSA